MKRRINKNGFTLVEILTVILILGLLTAIAIPAITRYIRLGEEKYYKSLEEELVIIGRDYYIKNKDELPRGQLNSKGIPMYINQVDLNTLKEKGYVTNDIVSTKKEPCTGYVRVDNIEKNEYEYIACIKCGNYTSENNNPYCTLDDNFNNNTKELTCDIDVGEYQPGKWTNKDVSVTVTSKYVNDNQTPKIGMYKIVNGDKLRATDNKITFKISESKNLTIYSYDRLGNSGSCTQNNILIDKNKPIVSFSSENIKKDDNGIKITATLTDDNGIVAYQVNQSGSISSTDWIAINETKQTTVTTNYLTTTNSTTYYIWAKDVAGNVSNKKITVKINWGNWGATTCNGLLCNKRVTANICTSYTTNYSEWSYYTKNPCSPVDGITCEQKTGTCKFAVSYPSPNNSTCPSGYDRYQSENCENKKIYCGSNEWYEVGNYTTSQAQQKTIELRQKYGVNCVFYDCYQTVSMYRTRTITGYTCNSWTGYKENQSCEGYHSNLCQTKEEYQKGTYTYEV